MLKNAEFKEKNQHLECTLFQKQYEMKKKRDKLEEEEKVLIAQLNKLKKSVHQQAARNTELMKQYILVDNKKRNHKY